jgi:hypothetical protein
VRPIENSTDPSAHSWNPSSIATGRSLVLRDLVIERRPDVREHELADAGLARVVRRLPRRHVERQEVVAVLPGRLREQEVGVAREHLDVVGGTGVARVGEHLTVRGDTEAERGQPEVRHRLRLDADGPISNASPGATSVNANAVRIATCESIDTRSASRWEKSVGTNTGRPGSPSPP